MIFERFETSKCCSSSNHLVAEAGFVLLEIIVLVDLLVVVFLAV
jgi:hypothetical protein